MATRIATLDAVNSARGLVDSLALAPDVGLVATGERGGQIRVWVTTGEPTPVSLGDYRQAVVDLAFSPDGRLLASLGRHREGALRLWRPDDRAAPGAWTEAASLPMGRCLALRFDGSGARLARSAPAFGAIDLVPLGGLAAALVLGIVWLVADDARLRPCRNGNDEACGVVATALLESAERAPSAPPTPGEERAARVLAEHRCRVADRGLCGLQRYAVGTVDARAGRFDAAKEAFLWACDADRSWCARTAQEPLAWTPTERKRLSK